MTTFTSGFQLSTRSWVLVWLEEEAGPDMPEAFESDDLIIFRCIGSHGWNLQSLQVCCQLPTDLESGPSISWLWFPSWFLAILEQGKKERQVPTAFSIILGACQVNWQLTKWTGRCGPELQHSSPSPHVRVNFYQSSLCGQYCSKLLAMRADVHPADQIYMESPFMSPFFRAAYSYICYSQKAICNCTNRADMKAIQCITDLYRYRYLLASQLVKSSARAGVYICMCAVSIAKTTDLLLHACIIWDWEL